MGAAPRSAPPTRVLVVDDSVVARQVVARALAADDGLELAGVAANGQIALDKIERIPVDVIVLDLEMPVLDGFATLRAVRASHPHLPVIVFSHLTAAGATATLDALALGATAFAAKPGAAATALDPDHVRNELIPLIKAVARTASTRTLPVPMTAAAQGMTATAVTRPAPAPRARATALVVAVSTGGPPALTAIVRDLPTDLCVPVFIVQHMPPLFTAQLAERLDRLGPLAVVEGTDGEPVVPGTIYLAPGGLHMAIERDGAQTSVRVHDGPPENSCRPAADVLFRSAVSVYGRDLLGLVLTGMGRDGLNGATEICRAGGSVIVQDQATAVVGSMPGAVADAALADGVFPLDRIAAELGRRLQRRPAS